jgi:hypothetical protein
MLFLWGLASSLFLYSDFVSLPVVRMAIPFIFPRRLLCLPVLSASGTMGLDTRATVCLA